MGTILVSEQSILEYIPQRSPIVMITELESYQEGICKTNLFIKNDNIFVSDGKFTEPGIIENIAQSAAAMTGYIARQNDGPVKKGFIGAVKKLAINKLPISNHQISTQISVLNEVMNVTIIEGKVFQDKELIASCEMNIFLED